jgi:hypothetical protein
MKKERIELIIQNIELLVNSLKKEIFDDDTKINLTNFHLDENDYDEIYQD